MAGRRLVSDLYGANDVATSLRCLVLQRLTNAVDDFSTERIAARLRSL